MIPARLAEKGIALPQSEFEKQAGSPVERPVYGSDLKSPARLNSFSARPVATQPTEHMLLQMRK